MDIDTKKLIYVLTQNSYIIKERYTVVFNSDYSIFHCLGWTKFFMFKACENLLTQHNVRRETYKLSEISIEKDLLIDELISLQAFFWGHFWQIR